MNTRKLLKMQLFEISFLFNKTHSPYFKVKTKGQNLILITKDNITIAANYTKNWIKILSDKYSYTLTENNLTKKVRGTETEKFITLQTYHIYFLKTLESLVS